MYAVNQQNFSLSAQLLEDEKRKQFEDFKLAVHEWIYLAAGEFSVRDLDYDMGIQQDSKVKKNRTLALEELLLEGVIERVGKKRGVYRQVKKDMIEIDYKNADQQSVDLWLPFEIHKIVRIMPGNIIQINGEKNSGKTAFMLNIVKNNQNKFNVHYFNSEMGAGELKMRLSLFDGLNVNDWKMRAYERSADFADVIFPGEGNINIIDFLELHDEFYRMGEYMRQIHDALKGAIAIVAIQKNPGVDMGLGGSRTEEKPRLILNISHGKVKIKMAKNWVSANGNPNGKYLKFKLVNGCKLIQDCSGWLIEK
jgi:hypothetical protein